jgi:translation initiation factor 4G
MDQRKAGWKSRNKQAGVMTIAEIHQQAAREQAEKSAQSRESISRGGSRAGHSRRDGPQPGEWQSVATTPRPVQRPADFSRVGQFGSSSGLPSAPTFGPTSVFSKGRKPGAAGTTPPLSRQPSSTNMFNILSGESEPATTERRTSCSRGPSRCPVKTARARVARAKARTRRVPRKRNNLLLLPSQPACLKTRPRPRLPRT